MNYIVTIPYRGVIPHLLKRGPIGTPIEIGEDMYEKLKASGVPMNIVAHNAAEDIKVAEAHHIPETPVVPNTPPMEIIEKPEPVTPTKVIEEPEVLPTEEPEAKDDVLPTEPPVDVSAATAETPSDDTEEDDGEDEDTTPEQKTSWTEEELMAMPKSRRRKCRKIMADNAAKNTDTTVE